MKMKDFCRGLSYLVLISGIIGAFIIADAYGVNTKVSTSNWSGVSTVTERNWGLTIGIFIGTMVSVLVLFAILGALAEILERLEPKKEVGKEIKEVKHQENQQEKKVSQEPTQITKDDKVLGILATIIIFAVLIAIAIVLL